MAVETSLPPKQDLFSNHDLFSDGASEEDESSPNPPPSPGAKTPQDSDNEPSQSTVPKPRRKRQSNRPKKSDVQKMHSETQRLIRESSVNLPKYQPKVKTLDGFLTKLTRNKKTTPPVTTTPVISTVDKENIIPDDVPISLLDPSSPLNDSSNKMALDTTSIDQPTNHTPSALPALRSFDNLEVTVGGANTELTSVEKLKSRFFKHVTIKDKANKRPVDKETVKSETTASAILSQDELSQPGLAPGAIREKLKAKLRSKMAKVKAEERKLMEERRKLDEEELYNGETGELSDMEAQLECEEEDSYDSEEEWRSAGKKEAVSEERSEGEESGEEEGEGIDKEEKGESEVEDNEHEGSDSDRGSDDIDSEGSDDDDDVYFVPGGIKRNRIIESDDEISEHGQYSVTKEDTPNDILSLDNEDKSCDYSDKSCDSKDTSHDIKTATNNTLPFDNNTLEEASMEPLVYSGTLDRGGETLLDEPVNKITSQLLVGSIDESSQLTELVQEEEGGRDMETSYQLGPSLPPHQLPRVIREESDELFMTTPSVTRQSSTVSDKDVLRGLEAYPQRIATQLPASIGLVDEETQFLDANGFLCIRNQDKVKSPYSAISHLVDTDSRPAPTPQLLALCSGSFHPTNRQDFSHKKLSTLDSTGLGIDDNTTDLLGLCSGAFPTATGPTQSLPRHLNFSSDEEESMPQVNRKKIFKRKKNNSKRLKDFVESEAELSGSGVSEDEEMGGVSEDSYEEEGGSDVPLSDNELRDQVNKVHMKHLVADDNAEIKNIQERFLLEGDLFEDGMQMKNGFFRTRRFTHGSEVSQDLFAEDRNIDLDNEEEATPIGSQAEAKRRKERLEKEEFIKKSVESRSLLEYDESSQSILELIRETSNHTPVHPIAPVSTSTGKSSRGSFLKHRPQTLKRLASVGSSTPGMGSGRSFVFQTGVNNEAERPNESAKPSSGLKPPRKKPCYKKSISLPSGRKSIGSIFDTLN